ncbi:uncharacterized protein LOC101735977 isoform X2 [Bombyx mori]|uniref:tRNA-splicing endonuclease subunit Sen54 N-terminal domain-containing protein n=1 Tax=Bombyx mori TaxID=7091 RepID=A0A8R2AXA8_BOMMO|nr:uncharacterized protein LOC101735977 isoform X2 [Bombyx mori]
MPDPKLLSGEELVAKGVTRTEGALPIIGLKEVVPNGSWLEQKQIQVALEARKHLIEVNRIEKQGSLSHAEWRNDLRLAEVIRQTGGYWQFYGHHQGKKLYLKPEEALFLMESNCLRLNNNGITMSLQEAYSILLNEELLLLQYQVYASLSRLGCKVYRHVVNKKEKTNSNEDKLGNTITNKDTDVSSESNMEIDYGITEIGTRTTERHANKKIDDGSEISNKNSENNAYDEVQSNDNESIATSSQEIDNTHIVDCESDDELTVVIENDSSKQNNKNTDVSAEGAGSTRESNDETEQNLNEMKLRKLLERKYKSTNANALEINFKKIPDFYQKTFATVKAPEEQFIPKNIYVNKTSYVLNVENLKTKDIRNTSSNLSYTSSDEPNESLKSIGNGSRNEIPAATHFYPNTSTPRMTNQYRPYNWWRPRGNFNYFHFNMFFQRPYFPQYFVPRFQFQPRVHPVFRSYPDMRNAHTNVENAQGTRNSRKRPRDTRMYHLQIIKNLAGRLKRLIASGNLQISNIQSIQKVIQTYNHSYKCKLTLTDNFDLVDETVVIETIELDTEEESQNKRQRVNEDTFTENFNKLKELALKLKDLNEKDQVTSRHRRAFSNAIKTFNKSFNADIYMNSNYDMIDRRQVVLDTSSDSEDALNQPNAFTKKLKNPFNIIKRFNEIRNVQCTIDKDNNGEPESDIVKPYDTKHRRPDELSKHWYPSDDDFGRAEVVRRDNARITDIFNNGYIYSLISECPNKYESWLEIKIAFLKCIEITNKHYKNQIPSTSADTSALQPLVKPGDFSDLPKMLEKLQIITADTHIPEETSLRIDFDVYNRSIKSFRKSNKPKPDFRLSCIDESCCLPSAADVSALISKYEDDVPTIFAVVGLGSISYVQIKPIVLPVYMPNE